MRIRTVRISVLALCFGALLSSARFGGAAMAAGLPTPDNDPLNGKWLIIEGQTKDQGFAFDATITGSCGRADFRPYLHKVKLEPNSPPGTQTVPWGEYRYRFDQKDVLTLTPLTGPEIRCFLKYKDESIQSLGAGMEGPMPFVFVFYEPEGHRAFKMISVYARRLSCPPVYVPYEDILTGSWEILASRLGANGQLDVPLSTSATTVAAHLTVHANNSAELTSGGATLSFQLRQFDPTHWAIVPRRNASCTSGTITLEQTTRRLLGPAFLPIRWQAGQKNMAAVLRSQGIPAQSNVPVLQFPSAEPLNFDALKLSASTPPVAATAPPSSAAQAGKARDSGKVPVELVNQTGGQMNVEFDNDMFKRPTAELPSGKSVPIQLAKGRHKFNISRIGPSSIVGSVNIAGSLDQAVDLDGPSRLLFYWNDKAGFAEPNKIQWRLEKLSPGPSEPPDFAGKAKN